MSNQPTKLVPERITISFNFLDVMQWGDTIVDYGTNVEVHSGEDPFASMLLFGRPGVAGPILRQQINLGMPGVIYKLAGTVQTSMGDVWERDCLIGVLPDNAPIPPPFGTYITSTPYPYVLTDGLNVSSGITSGYELGALLDNLNVSTVVISGILNTPLQTYVSPPESINVVSGIVSGSIATTQRVYIIPPESINVSTAIISGSLVMVLIVYSNWPPEPINVSSNVISGSLV